MEDPSHRDVVLAKLTKEGWKRGAELGIGKGHLAELLLRRRRGLHLIGVDHFTRPGLRERIQLLENKYPKRYTVFAMTTRAAAPLVPDASLDFVFIDAAHSYTAVAEDIQMWTPKVRPGGCIGGHDFHDAYPGVERAVREAFGTGAVIDHAFVWWFQR